MTTRPSPAFTSYPVILVHILASPETRTPWCSDTEDYWPDDGSSFPGVPRVMCPACAKAPAEYGTPKEEAHVHRASCHGAIGELQCGFPAY